MLTVKTMPNFIDMS